MLFRAVSLASILAVTAFFHGACERHDWQETKVLYESHHGHDGHDAGDEGKGHDGESGHGAGSEKAGGEEQH